MTTEAACAAILAVLAPYPASGLTLAEIDRIAGLTSAGRALPLAMLEAAGAVEMLPPLGGGYHRWRLAAGAGLPRPDA